MVNIQTFKTEYIIEQIDIIDEKEAGHYHLKMNWNI